MLRAAGCETWVVGLRTALAEWAVSRTSLSIEKLRIRIEVGGQAGAEVVVTLTVDSASLQPGSTSPDRMSVCVNGLAVEVTRSGDPEVGCFPMLMQPLCAELALTLSQPPFKAADAGGRWRPPLVMVSLSATVDKLDLTPTDGQLQLLLRVASSLSERTRLSLIRRDGWALARLLYARGKRLLVKHTDGVKLPWISRVRLALQAMRTLVQPSLRGLLPRLYCEVYSRHLEARLEPGLPSEVSWSDVHRDFKGFQPKINL